MKPFNYITREFLAVITVLIATTTSVDVFAQSKGSILVYVTADGDGEGDYPADAFNVGLLSILTNHGYDVTLTDRIETPQVTSTLLESFDQLWILSTDGDTIGHFNQSEIAAINGFRQQGHGLLIMAEHNSYGADANQIANLYGVNFHGKANHGENEPITPVILRDYFFREVKTIFGHNSEPLISFLSDEVVGVATYGGDTLIAAVSPMYVGRVVFDATFTRFQDCCINIGDTPQYVRNVADWLQRLYTPVPSYSTWSLMALTLLLLLAGTTLIILKRQPARR